MIRAVRIVFSNQALLAAAAAGGVGQDVQFGLLGRLSRMSFMMAICGIAGAVVCRWLQAMQSRWRWQ